MAMCIWALFHNASSTAQGEEAGEVFGRVYHCAPGPWGDLEYYPIHIEMPDYLAQKFPLPEEMPRWNFPRGSESSVRGLFERVGVAKELQDELMRPGRHELYDGMLTLFPTVRALLALTQEQRAVIYQELARSHLNPYHAGPICIANHDPDSWFAQSGMRPELVEMVKRMSYWRGGMLCFSDLEVLFSMVSSDEEARNALKALSRTRTLMLRINVKASPDAASLMRYWSANRLNKEIEPILQSAVEIEGMNTLDGVHLMPPLVRRYLYCYPAEEFQLSGVVPDCHWTSLNFFNTTALNYPFNPSSFDSSLTGSYDAVEAPYQLGDVLMLVTSGGEAVHSCVYIADDITYTKNGETPAAPWLLMKIADVKQFYSFDEAVTVRGYRMRGVLRPMAQHR